MESTDSTRFARYRSARHAARRRQRRVRIALSAVGVFLVLLLAAGFVWDKGWLRTQPEVAPVEPATAEQRTEARLLLDRAVQARYAELTNEAIRLAVEARRKDPAVPGAALFTAELALRQGDAEIAGAAAREALKQSQYAANAQLILALNAWMLRAQTGTDSAGSTATQLLSEAADAELSNGAVRFFAGDVQRAIGLPSEAHRSLLGGLYRQEPWHSAAVLTARLALSLDEADGSALLDVGEQSEVFGKTASALGQAQRAQVDTQPAASAVSAVFTRKHLDILARDPALSAAVPRVPENGDSEKALFLPFGEIVPPTGSSGPDYPMPWEQDPKPLDINKFHLHGDALGSP